MKEKMRIAIYCVCGVALSALVVTGIKVMQTQQGKSVPTTTVSVNNESNTYTVKSESSLAVDISNPDKMAGMSQYVAIVKINSLEGVDNYSQVEDEYVLPYTYGNMTVIKDIKGGLPVGEDFEFYRLGGAISVDEYYESLSETERVQFDRAKKNSNELAEADYIEVLDADDIRIESGKTYLVYMVNETAYRNKPDTYAIIGYKGGLREVQFNENNFGAQSYSSAPIGVLNNFTGKWEELGDITRLNDVQ